MNVREILETNNDLRSRYAETIRNFCKERMYSNSGDKEELQEKWDFRDGQVFVDDEHGGLMYSESAQEIFNRLYDEYYTIIDQLKR